MRQLLCWLPGGVGNTAAAVQVLVVVVVSESRPH